jgi:hypothetical protein
MKPLLFSGKLICIDCNSSKKGLMKYEAVCKNIVCNNCRDIHTNNCEECLFQSKQKKEIVRESLLK